MVAEPAGQPAPSLPAWLRLCWLSVIPPRRPRLLWLGALLAMAGAGAVLVPVLTRGSPLSARDRRWQQDIAYLARELPRVHVRGLAWEAAASRLEAKVHE